LNYGDATLARLVAFHAKRLAGSTGIKLLEPWLISEFHRRRAIAATRRVLVRFAGEH